MNSLKPFNKKYTIYTMECEYTANTSPADSDVIMFKNVRNDCWVRTWVVKEELVLYYFR